MTKHTAAQLVALLAAIGLTYPIAMALAAVDLRPLVGAACTIAFFSTALTVTGRLAARLAPAPRPARRAAPGPFGAQR
ncbi:hypothetical protein [Streptomyces albidoflavus]|uniref:hypothetical protein n=1 Tax=Streptomyces albidoflavus TaxID=1886 RepID=UPI0004CB21D6|nr:hypothetical protein [Streptomyces albidoflavus]